VALAAISWLLWIVGALWLDGWASGALFSNLRFWHTYFFWVDTLLNIAIAGALITVLIKVRNIATTPSGERRE